jgi:cytochrome c-type biogenesis protein CcmH
MTLWLILTILTVGAALIVAAPFLFRGGQAGEAASSINVYKDQLAEVERDKAQGLIDEAEAGSMRVEIERRILSAGKGENAPAERIVPNWQYHMVTGTTAIVVLGSVGLYASLGRPELSSVAPQAQDGWAQRAAVAANAGAQGPVTQTADGQQQGGGDIEAMVKRLEQRLEANPNDSDGWRVLGWSYDSVGRNKDAVTAYGRAVELQKDNATLRAIYGEAQVKAADGVVTAAALATFEEVLAINPNDERGRFFKGVAKVQKGDNQGGIDEWLALYKIAPAEAEWTGDLRTRIEETAKQAGIDVAAKLAEAKPAAAAVAQAPSVPGHPGAVGPSAADIENAKQLSEQDRNAMVSSMVDRLAGRLETSPKDPDGWIMLIRSRVAMKDAEKARAALEKAKTVFADEPETQQRIVQAAQAMGIAAN